MIKKNTANTGALRPNFFAGLPKSLQPAQREGVMAIDDEERSLAALANTSGWTVLSTYVDNLLTELDEVTNAGMAQGLSLEDIGRNALVANLSKGMIRRIQQKVTDAVEAVEGENERT